MSPEPARKFTRVGIRYSTILMLFSILGNTYVCMVAFRLGGGGEGEGGGAKQEGFNEMGLWCQFSRVM